MILSDKNCTGVNGTVYHNQENYINVGVTNTGGATAQSFVVRIEVQGSLVAFTSVDSLSPGGTFEWCGPSHEFDLGTNSVEIWVDFFGEVQESNEGDNYYLTNVQCDSAEISAEGEMRYYELVSGMQYVTVAQSYWIEMFGKDDDGSEQLLASGFAVDEVFSLGPVPNYNGEGNRWNVFLKVYAVNPSARLLELTKQS